MRVKERGRGVRIREEFPTPAADVVERREEGKRESRRSGRSEEEGGADGWGRAVSGGGDVDGAAGRAR